MEMQKQNDKGTDFTFYVLFVSMALGALLSIGYLLSTFFLINKRAVVNRPFLLLYINL